MKGMNSLRRTTALAVTVAAVARLHARAAEVAVR